jgi:hypothetical protein
LWPGPGKQGVLLDERQSVLHRRLMGAFDHRRHRRISDRPQTRHRLHRGERQVIPSNCLGPRPRIFRDLSRQFPSIDRLPAMLGEEKLTGHLGPHPRPMVGRLRRAGGEAGRRIDRPDAFGHLEPERPDDTIDNPERSSKPGRILEVTWGEVRSFQLLMPELGQRMQAAAEQCPHLLRGHRVAGGQALDPVQAGADPPAWCLTPFGVVRRQAGLAFLGRVQGCDLAGQVVIPGTRGELVDAHRHTHLKGYMPPERSGRPELLPACMGCVEHRILKSAGGA